MQHQATLRGPGKSFPEIWSFANNRTEKKLEDAWKIFEVLVA